MANKKHTGKRESSKAKNPPLPQPSAEDQQKWLKGQKALNSIVQANKTLAPKDRTPVGESFREHGKARPGRASHAGRALRAGSDTLANTPERAQAVEEWKSRRPGGGSPSGATHSQWVSWGVQNPNRASNAGRALGQQRQFGK